MSDNPENPATPETPKEIRVRLIDSVLTIREAAARWNKNASTLARKLFGYTAKSRFDDIPKADRKLYFKREGKKKLLISDAGMKHALKRKNTLGPIVPEDFTNFMPLQEAADKYGVNYMNVIYAISGHEWRPREEEIPDGETKKVGNAMLVTVDLMSDLFGADIDGNIVRSECPRTVRADGTTLGYINQVLTLTEAADKTGLALGTLRTYANGNKRRSKSMEPSFTPEEAHEFSHGWVIKASAAAGKFQLRDGQSMPDPGTWLELADAERLFNVSQQELLDSCEGPTACFGITEAHIQRKGWAIRVSAVARKYEPKKGVELPDPDTYLRLVELERLFMVSRQTLLTNCKGLYSPECEREPVLRDGEIRRPADGSFLFTRDAIRRIASRGK